MAAPRFSNGLAGPVTTLPLDWAQDPHSSRSWCLELHALQWLDIEALPEACAIALDWIAANPLAAPSTSMAWNDMAVARRGPVLARLAGQANGEHASTLRESAAEHARWLADDRNYRARTNHGIAEDEA